MRYLNSFCAFLIMFLLVGCDSPTAVESEAVYVMRAEIIDPAHRADRTYIAFSGSEINWSNWWKEEIYFPHDSPIKETVLIGNETATLAVFYDEMVAIIADGPTPPTFQILTDWQVSEKSGGVTYTSGSEIDFDVWGRVLLPDGSASYEHSRYVENRILDQPRMSVAISLPTTPNVNWFVFPMQRRQVGCRGNGSATFASRDGVIRVIRNGGYWHRDPVRYEVDRIRVTCTRYESVHEARTSLTHN